MHNSFPLQQNPRNNRSSTSKYKDAIKTQENNITLNPMYCQVCHIYGL